MKPGDIEALSFNIIDQEAGPHDFSLEEWEIVRRMIHTSADFEYMQTVRFHPEAIAAGIRAIAGGGAVITDTEMVRAGISPTLKDFGVRAACLIRDEHTIARAATEGTTRARAAVDAAVPLMKHGIYAVGNAPTALLRLIELVAAGQAEPALIIGLPVGFVNAAESKAALLDLNFPCITNQGRKGGSNVAASVVNALARLAKKHKKS